MSLLKKDQEFRHYFYVSEKIYNGFMEIFDDRNCLHTDLNFARQKGFKDKVMHGNILNGFLSYAIGECLPFKNVMIYRQEIQYFKPVYLNDELEMILTVDDVFDSLNTIELKYFFENKEKQIVAKGKIQIGVI